MQSRQAFKPTPVQAGDIGISLVVGLVFAVLSAWVIAPDLFVSKWLYLAPNLGDYCEVLGLWDVQDVPQAEIGESGPGVLDFRQPGRRTMTASLPAKVFLGPLGIIDGLAAGALLGSWILGASLYLWGAALAGRLAGVFTVAAALATGDLCLLARHFTFYPTIISSFAATAALTAITARAKNHRGSWFLIAGLGIGFSLLVDVRGIIWVALCIPLLVITALKTTGWRRKLLGLGLLFLPVCASFQAGEWNNGGLLPMSLEEQVDVRPLRFTQGLEDSEFSPQHSYQDGFSWGNSSLKSLPNTFRFLAEQIQMELPQKIVDSRPVETQIYYQRVQQWEVISIVGLLIVVTGLRKDRWGLLILVVTGAPYVAAQLGIRTHHEFRVRFLLQTLPFTSVIIGVAMSYCLALAVRCLGFLGTGPLARLQMHLPRETVLWRRSGAAVAILMVINSAGWIPGPLSPTAAWRGPPWMQGEAHASNLLAMIGDPQLKKMRMESLLEDDPWANPAGLSRRWVFRNQTCLPKLLSTSESTDQIFKTTFYRR